MIVWLLLRWCLSITWRLLFQFLQRLQKNQTGNCFIMSWFSGLIYCRFSEFALSWFKATKPWTGWGSGKNWKVNNERSWWRQSRDKRRTNCCRICKSRNPKHVTSKSPTWAVGVNCNNIRATILFFYFLCIPRCKTLLMISSVARFKITLKALTINTRGMQCLKKESCTGFDCRGDLEQTPGLSKKNYKLSWTNEDKYIEISGVRPKQLKFYKLP